MRLDSTKQYKALLRKRSAVIREVLSDDLLNASVFIVPYKRTEQLFSWQVDEVCRALASSFMLRRRELDSHALLFAGSTLEVQPQIALEGVFIVGVDGSQVREALVAYSGGRRAFDRARTTRNRLADYGVLFSRTPEISCHSFAHGVGHYYRFRVATHKLATAPKAIRDYLLTLPTHCPNQYFLSGPRASNYEIALEVDPKHTKDHPLIARTREALDVRRFKSAHEDVEKSLLESDPYCIATEVPVWFESEEMSRLGLIVTPGENLTGHIDVLRYDGDVIGIWDFKPAAAREETATVQVYLYARMLSVRTGVPLESVECGYFDEQDAFEFSASDARHHTLGEFR